MIIADTNVVAEFMKDQPDATVMEWAQQQRPADLGICVVTVQEVDRGLQLLPRGRRRGRLEERWGRLLAAFVQSIVVYDVAAAREAARLQVAAQRAGRVIPLADAQIAGICRAGSHQLATRYVRDFDSVRHLTIVNPFQTGRPEA